MFKNLTSSSPHVYVSSGSSSSPPWIGSSSNPVQGMIRINGSDLEVYDSSGWITIHTVVSSIGLNKDAEDAISWAIQRMREEQEWKKIAETNEAMRIAYQNLENARRQLDITAKLARDYDTETTS